MNWKDHLYSSYITSGQAQERASSAEEQFRPRAFYLRQIIREHVPGDRNARILDIGCGHGVLLYFLCKSGYNHCAGVDASAEQVEFAKRMGIENVEAGDAMEFLKAQQPSSADVVCLFDILEHLDRQELFEILHHVRRVLAPGGRCIGHVPNGSGIFGMFIRYGDLTHELAFTSNSLRQVFRALGFAGVDCYEDKPIPHGFTSLVRRVLWDIGTVPFRILAAAESGNTGGLILSRNLLFVAKL